MTPDTLTPNCASTQTIPGFVLQIADKALSIPSPALFHKTGQENKNKFE